MKMKHIISLLLSFVMVLGMLSGCGNNRPETTDPVQNTAPSQTQATTEVTEPVPQLGEALQEVYDLGIADMELLLRSEDVCTRAEAIEMLAEAYAMRRGEKSMYLKDMVDAFDADRLADSATRYYLAQAIYFSAVEVQYGDDYVSWSDWIEYCDSKEWGGIWPDGSIIGFPLGASDDMTAGEGGLWEYCADLGDIDIAPAADALYTVDYGSCFAVNYAMVAYDRRDGTKIMELDENSNFRPHETMTVAQVAEAALRYYHYFEDKAEMVSYADTYTFDTSIITPELLAKETTLPDASCAELPSEWRGTLIYNGRMPAGFLDRMPDKHYYEYMFQTVKDAGLNFVGITFDFSRLQGPELQTGMLNETRLKELDQVIAWCMERDIHVDLRCCGMGGQPEDVGEYWYQWNLDAPNTTEYAPEFAALWKALAQRYADIPNCYLSFNLYVEPGVNSESQYAAFFGPAVTAIREADPDRCIIADIHSSGLTGECMAKMGVALSFHAYDPREFCCLTLENQNDTEYLSTVKWPFTASDGKTYNAEAVLDSQIPNSISANELAATAKEYGVGFMIGEWGIFGEGLTRYRYPDETIEAFLKDMADTMEEKGYGWCYGNFHYPYSIACFAPAVVTGDYVKVEGTPLYIEQKMMGWFQEINGVK